MTARYKLHCRKQKTGESCEQFLLELRKLSVNCAYSKEELDLILLNAFIFGLQNKTILDRVLEEPKPTLEKARNLAFTMESALVGASDVLDKVVDKVEAATTSSVKKVTDFSSTNNKAPNKKKGKKKKNSTPSENQKNSRNNETEDVTCYKCKKKGHKANKCNAKVSCSYCGRPNHTENYCRFKKRNEEGQNRSNTTNAIEVWPVNLITDDEEDVPARFVHVFINETKVSLELDCGSGKTVINYKTYKAFSKNSRFPLVTTRNMLQVFNLSFLKPLGMVHNLPVCYNNVTKLLSVVVASDQFANVFGCNWMRVFGIKADFNDDICRINKVNFLSDDSIQEKLNNLLSKYSTVLSESMGKITNCEISLQLRPNTKPKFCNARTVAFSIRECMDLEYNSLEIDGVITKIPYSDWATPVVPVVKPSGHVRICADYSSSLNPALEDVIHHLARMEELFSKFNGGKRFTKLDIRSAYLHMPVTLESSLLLTINTHRGLYRCNRLMYGVKTAPAIWQRYMDNLLKDIPGVCVFYDDIVVTAPNDTVHLSRIEEIIKRLAESNIRLNIEKSKFFQKEVEYLGFKFSAEGMQPTTSKIRAILEIPRPISVEELKAFLGLITFYGHFVQDLATIAYPLNQLTQQNIKFIWSKNCEEAFLKIKQILASAKTLVHYSLDLPLILSVDTSPFGVGAVLSHLIDGVEKPIEFASKTLSKSQQRYSQIDKEALAIHWGVEKFFYYLFS